MRIILSFFLFVITFNGYAQLLKIDTVLDKRIYESYFNLKLKEPLYVTYTLFKGGGNCDREDEGFNFFVDGFKMSATDQDYAGSGFDKGHLANAEDFAFECEYEELTFRYYNCVPQTVRMNRGIWKKWETDVRKLSQTKKILIVAGSIFGKKKLGDNKIGIPSHCYKIVIDPGTKKILHCLVFPNNNSNTFQVVTFTELKQRLGYRLIPTQFWKSVSQKN
ncbi:MAG TPA: DNA/RNA non-specific endonuclease [Ferruginibacter sp.]|nr:DNA/RNA non-specific endonuclease [Ferruginibacter sp.]